MLEKPKPNRAELVAKCILDVSCNHCAALPGENCITPKSGAELRPMGRQHWKRDQIGLKLFHKRYGQPFNSHLLEES